MHKKAAIMYLPTTGLYPLLAFHVSYSNVSMSAKSHEIIHFAVNSIVSLLEDLSVLTFLNVLTTSCNLQDGFATAVIYIDFSEAFDLI